MIAPRPYDALLDTDIGSDVDDALALGVLLGSPEVSLRGATTVYGDTLLRARLARRLASLAGHDLTVVPGAAETLSGREVWWAGHEGDAFDDLSGERVRDDIGAPASSPSPYGPAPVGSTSSPSGRSPTSPGPSRTTRASRPVCAPCI